MKASSKKWLPMVLIIPVLIGGYFVFAKYQSWWPFGVEQEGWKTYKNSQFEFKYPVSFDVEETEDYLLLHDVKRGESIFVGTLGGSLTLNRVVENKYGTYPQHTEGIEQTKVGDRTGYIFEEGEVCSSSIVYGDMKNETLKIQFTACPIVEAFVDNPISSNKRLINQILSTFKFTPTP